jgi:DNA-binding MarR family transcriptional regulator
MQKITTLQKQIKEFQNVVDNSQTSINHMVVFAAICQEQPTTSNDLNKKIGLERSTTNRLLHSLADQGRGNVEGANVIEIKMMPEDKRHREIKLTDKGKKLMTKMFGAKK